MGRRIHHASLSRGQNSLSGAIHTITASKLLIFLTNDDVIMQIRRNGMWYFGTNDYYLSLLEYASWSIITGFPNAYINDVFDVETLLYYLADESIHGTDFRAFVAYISTTFLGQSSSCPYPRPRRRS